MRLLSCYIDHFGRFNNESFSFEKGLTDICEENGYGKTTLSAFLVAMFYGMEPTRKNGKFNDRVRYFPFEGGNFGGNVEFIYKEKTYRIERRFDETSDTRDLLAVYRDNEPFEELGAVPGEKLFGIDKGSFERTVFLTSKEVELSATDGIHTKLNSFVEGSEDSTRLEAALERLEDRAKDYKRSRGSGGLIPAETERIKELREQLNNGKTVREELPRKYDRLNEYKKQEGALTAKITAAQSESTQRAHWEQYDRMQEEIKASEAAIFAIDERYPLGLPSENEVEQVLMAFSEEEKGLVRAEKTAFSAEDSAKYAKLAAHFDKGLPEEELLGQTEQAQKKLQELQARAGVLREAQDMDKDEPLHERFAIHEPTEKELLALKNEMQSYKAASKTYQELEDAETANSGRSFVLLWMTTVLMCLAGIGMIVSGPTSFSAYITGIVMLLISSALAIFTSYLGINQHWKSKKRAGKLVAVRAEQDSAAMHIGVLLLPYGCDELGDGVYVAGERFLQDLKRYAELKKRMSGREMELSQVEWQLTEIKKSLDEFFARYGISRGNDLARWAQLQTMISEYQSLQKRKNDADTASREAQDMICGVKEQIRAFFGKYRPMEAPAAADAEIIREELRARVREAARLSQKTAEAEAFRKEKRLESRPDGAPAQLDELNRRLHAVSGEIQKLTSQILTDERDIERDDELQNELAAHEAQLAEYKKQYDVLQKTMDMLRAADRKCKDKYIRPIREAFRSYSDVLEKALGERIVMDADLNIRFEANGRVRNEAHLSAGQRSICAFCFRLALIDNMYADEKPFLILDDPFVGLDEAHLVRVRALMAELAGERQLIYFSCHKSRQMRDAL